MIKEQKYDSSGRGYNHAIKIQSSYTGDTEHVGEPAAYNCPNYAEQNIEDHPFPTVVYEMAADESS